MFRKVKEKLVFKSLQKKRLAAALLRCGEENKKKNTGKKKR